jgi:hypothetical protein
MYTVDTSHDSIAAPAVEADAMRELTINELEGVSGGCPCTIPCGCDKPSPRIP